MPEFKKPMDVAGHLGEYFYRFDGERDASHAQP